MPVLRQETAASQRLAEQREEPVEDAGSAEFLADAPERVPAWHRVGERGPGEALVARTVRQLELRLLVREIVESSDDPELEDDLRMPGRSSTKSDRRPRGSSSDGWDERVPVHSLVEPVERVTTPGKIREPLVVFERSGRTAPDLLLAGRAHVPI